MRESGHGGTLLVFRRLGGWFKRHFPVLTRSGSDYAQARVAQEQAKARLLSARAEVELARAEQIRAQTRVLSGDGEVECTVFAVGPPPRAANATNEPAGPAPAPVGALLAEVKRLGPGPTERSRLEPRLSPDTGECRADD